MLGNNPYRNLLRVLEAINGLPTQPRFIIHTGDVANHDTEVAYELAAEAFAKIQYSHVLRDRKPRYACLYAQTSKDGAQRGCSIQIGPELLSILNCKPNGFWFWIPSSHTMKWATSEKYTEDQLDIVRAEVSRAERLIDRFHSSLAA